MLSILNSLAEYFHLKNSMLPISNATESVQQRPIYVEFEGPKSGLYVTFEEIISQKMEAKVEGVRMSWKKYIEIDEALNKARAMLGVNYYIEPIAKEYIKNSRWQKIKVLCSKIPQSIPGKKD